jgi:hypothetical protein
VAQGEGPEFKPQYHKKKKKVSCGGTLLEKVKGKHSSDK